MEVHAGLFHRFRLMRAIMLRMTQIPRTAPTTPPTTGATSCLGSSCFMGVEDGVIEALVEIVELEGGRLLEAEAEAVLPVVLVLVVEIDRKTPGVSEFAATSAVPVMTT